MDTKEYDGTKNLDKVLDFVAITNLFRGVQRDILMSREARYENNSEHSYQLAMVCWYIAKTDAFYLDKDKILKYALVHDLVEVYAGDTPLYSTDENFILSKHDREIQAALLIKKQFQEFPELHECINAYEERRDNESKFVSAVDKLLPILSIYLDSGYAWRNRGISIDMIIDKTASRISIVPEIKKYFDAIIGKMREKPEFFGNEI